jgi:hypothetical protein
MGSSEHRPNCLCIDAVDPEMGLGEILVAAVISGHGDHKAACRSGCRGAVTAVFKDQQLLRGQVERLGRLKIDVWSRFASSDLVATDQKLKTV